MTDTIVLGRKPDGELSKCVAKPENRGKGNCDHIAHFDYPTEKAEERIRKDAEEILERKYARKIATALKRQKQSTSSCGA